MTTERSEVRLPARWPTRALVIAVGLVVLAACVGNSPTGQELTGKVARRPGDREFLNGTVAADNLFASDLYRAAAREPGNFVYSPYVLLTNLAMARAGSAGETHDQFDTVLHAASTPDLDGGLNTLALELQDRSGAKESDNRKGTVSLIMAPSIWGQRGTHIKDSLLDSLSANFDTGFRLTDFHGDSEERGPPSTTGGRTRRRGSARS